MQGRCEGNGQKEQGIATTGKGPRKRHAAAGTEDDLQGIKAVAERLGVSARTLRFYEARGLIRPPRVANTRVYTRRETGRMQLILRAKRLGFPLTEIREFLDLYDVDPDHLSQTRVLAVKCRERIHKLGQQKEAIDQTLNELESIERFALEKIAQAEAAPAGAATHRREHSSCKQARI